MNTYPAESAPWVLGEFSSSAAHEQALVAQHGIPVWADMPNFRIGGDWRPEMFRALQSDAGRVAIIGPCFASDEVIRADVQRLHNSPEELTRDWQGSHSTLLFRGDTVTVIADTAGQRGLYYQQAAGRTFVSSRASLVGQLTGSRPDALTLAAHIGCPQVHELTAGRSFLEGIQFLEGGRVLHIGPHGNRLSNTDEQFEIDPSATFESAAERLGPAVRMAVLDRIATGLRLTTDRSAGLDSGSLTHIAAEHIPKLTAFTFYHTACTDDRERVKAQLDLLGSASSIDWHTHEMSGATGLYDGLQSLPLIDGPDVDVILRGSRQAYLRALRDAGSEMHLSGSGGDEISSLSPRAYLGDLVGIGALGPLLSAAYRTARSQKRAPAAVMREAWTLAHSSLADELRATAQDINQLQAEDIARRSPGRVGWFNPIGMGVTVLTQKARRSLSELTLERAAESVGIHAGEVDIGNFVTLAVIRESARQYSALAGEAQCFGFEYEFPFLDRSILRAALSIPAHMRLGRGGKAFLRQAMTGLVPSIVVDQSAKSPYDGVEYDAISGARADLEALFAGNPLLADLGIIEPNRVREVLELHAMGQPRLAPLITALANAEDSLRRAYSQPGQSSGRYFISAVRAESRATEEVKPLPSATRYNLSRHLFGVAVGQGLTLLNMKNEKYFRLNPTAIAVLNAISSTPNLGTAIDAYISMFPGVDPTILQIDAQSCVRDLAAKEIIVRRNGNRRSRNIPSIQLVADDLTATQEIRMAPHQLETTRKLDRALVIGSLLLDYLVLQRLPFRSTYALMRMLDKRWVNRDATTKEVQELLAATYRGTRGHLGRIACSEQSKITKIAGAIKRQRVPLVIGTKTNPNEHHMWNAINGQPVLLPIDPSVLGVYKALIVM